MMHSNPLDEPLRVLPFIFGALLSGMISLGVVAIFVAGGEATFAFGEDQLFLIVTALLVAGSIPVSLIVYRALMQKAQGLADEDRTERAYLTACIVRWALMEGAAMFCCVAVLVTGNLVFLVPLSVSLLFFLAAYPSRSRFEAFAGTGHVSHAALKSR